MKRIITLGIFLSFALTNFAQKLDYDNDSKWFFGLNAGAAWNTTDVKNKTNIGWGFILGRSFNYNYGKKISFDLRLRYLNGKWYGQDYDTTTTLGYNEAYAPLSGPIAGYDTTSGYLINNFQADVHELGLELALHLNSVRETHGWDPYIFGGANIVWNQTYGDLVYIDSLGEYLYNYSPSGMTKPEWNLMTDDTYDNALDGSNQNKYNVDFMPSLGIGLGYQVGPRFSVGVEHKTTFALKDVFDGYVNPEKRWGLFENDIYHYTSAYLKFNFRSRHREQHDETIIVEDDPIMVGSGDCDEPRIKISSPSSSSINVTSQEFTVRAKFEFVSGRDNIQFSVNQNASTNFAFNAANGNFEAPIFLQPGMNTIILSAGNGCGRDEETMNINYTPCTDPVVSFIAPSNGGDNVEQSSYMVSASIAGAESIQFIVNGVNTSGYSFNANTGAFSDRINLKPGSNVIRIIATNSCGNDEQTVSINYTECAFPKVNISGGNTINVDEPTYDLRGTVTNVSSKSNISFKVNGITKSFIYNTSSKLVQSVVALKSGSNTIQISATNDCGNDTETITVIYTPCIAPQIQMIVPTQSSLITEGGTQQIQAKLFNVNHTNEITLTVNGAVQSAGSFNSVTKIYNKTVSLNAGTNTIRLDVDNGCGVDSKTFIVTYRPCIAPAITMISPSTPNSATTNGTMLVKAQVANVASVNNIMLKVNGVILTGGTYNSNTNMFERAVSLSQGNNTIQITATGDCDTDIETFNVNYSNCADPIVTMIMPATVNSNVIAGTMLVKAIVSNVNSASQVVLKLNGNVVTGGSFNASTGLFQKSISLNSGANVISITGTNDCGMICETVTVNYTPCITPVITMISPISSNSTVNASTTTIKASILNVSSVNDIQLLVNGVVINGTFNSSTKIFTANVGLNAGRNTIQLTANSDCGNDVENVIINYELPCQEPTVVLNTPINQSTTSNTSQLIQATVMNVTGVNQIQLKVNGMVIAGGTYNSATHLFENTITLSKGNNTVVVTATNDCGVDNATSTVTFAPCLSPVVGMIVPAVSSSTVQDQSLVLKATITNISNASEVQVKLNGVIQSNGTYSSATNLFIKTLALVNGSNTIQVSATTDCGTNSKVFTVNYEPCLSPEVSMIAPTNDELNTSQATYNVKANVTNVSLLSQIELKHNGVIVNGGSLNGTLFQNNVNLVKGLNKFEIKVTTECGSKTIAFNLNFVPCTEPTVSIILPRKEGSVVATESIQIQAEVTGVSSVNQIVVKLNGVVIPGGTYNAQTNIFNHNVLLNEGNNLISFTVTNDCGSYTESRSIIFESCVAPTVNITSPGNDDSLDVNTVLLKANIQNAQSLSQISLRVNGALIGGATFNPMTGYFEKLITLGYGANNVELTVTNDCGTDNQRIQLHYVKCQEPVILILATGTAMTSSTILARAHIDHITSASQVKFYLNGNLVTGGTFDPSTKYYEKSVDLIAGTNTLRFEATNECGESIESGNAVYAPCTVPTVSMTSPSTDIQTTDASYLVKASVNGVISASQIQMIVNGVPVTGANYLIITHTYQKSIPLVDGVNTIQVIATNDCGTVSDQVVITKGTKAAEQMITICHKSGGKSTTMQIPISDWEKHKAHGDQLGTCKPTKTTKPKTGNVEKPKTGTEKAKDKAVEEGEKKVEEIKEAVDPKEKSKSKSKTDGGGK